MSMTSCIKEYDCSYYINKNNFQNDQTGDEKKEKKIKFIIGKI